jgi:peptidoglycan hydrolase-like protein with peptidoglycan-binding domain
MKRLLLATSILGLAAGGAFAQDMNSTPTAPPTSLSASPSQTGTAAPSTAASSNAGAQASQDQVAQAQQTLKQKGLYNGPVDGKFGPATRTAVSQFQKQDGLQQSAQLDQRTMNDLLGAGDDNAPMSGKSGGSSPAGKASGTGFSPQQDNNRDDNGANTGATDTDTNK